MAGVVIRVCTTWGRVFSLMPRQAVGAVRYSNVDAARGVGPVKGAENDPATRGNAPDDRRAGDIHIAEPKEITKKKVAEVSEEPEGLQGSKLMPGFDKPINPDAKPQSTTVDQNH
ncbi:uncharacterized protein [Physcomitrium patens]|uniref:Uncharacterized protein n=2 Tax=Physcomitrium patens TaxID=3218 RepID=A9T7U8_PHYPA|nr:uncharacterized protein LOC112283386 [Physcomitrium patens]PNR52144.1 hypothetical protein PHYPA_008518 [Physcomitrium patens]|eukprot:XP_024377773.1 uncharacterized protein LOC112283386 [Physcomitrella patens]